MLKRQDCDMKEIHVIRKSVFNMRASEPWQRVMQVTYDSLKMIQNSKTVIRKELTES